ncbi:MAG: proline dehydrogenase family protein [Gemmatimonadales bacterium]|jgi:proline dehydrogenase
MGVMRNMLLRGSESAWLAAKVQKRGFVQRAVRRFMPGDTIEAAVAAAEGLSGRNISSVLTLLGEAVADRSEAEAVAQHYAEVLAQINSHGISGHLSLKPTQFGFDIDPSLCAELIDGLVARASEIDSFVWIDMEASPYVDGTIELYRGLRATHENVGVCLQSYLYRTAKDLESLLEINGTVRLVKGAYKEPSDVAFPSKTDVDANFMKLAKRLLSADARAGRVRPAFGTHDMQLVTRIRDFAEGAGISKDDYEIQMLYGICRNDQVRLSAEGASVRVLISYGTAWFPWYMRRLAERPANLGFVVRSVFWRR